jgi:ATP-dependent Clp protease ATP-binding subunit ClpA
MFEKFTKEARQVVTAAVREAESAEDSRVGTEHLLLGIFGSGWPHIAMLESLGLTHMTFRQALDEADGAALAAVGIDPTSIHDEALDNPPRLRRRRHIPFTGAAKDVLKGALREALALNHRYIGPEHIFLALIELPPQDRALKNLNALGLEPGELRFALLAALRQAS